MQKNYNNEAIPDTSELLEKCQLQLERLCSLESFKFSDLFNTKIVGGKTEYWLRKGDLPFKLNARKGKSMSNNEIKGVYIFYKNGQPLYTGISRTVLRRIKYHFTRPKHNESSLVYLIVREQHEHLEKQEYSDNRDNLSLEKGIPLQSEMRKDWEIKILPIEDNYELYLTEVLIATKLKTYWNSFKTH